MGLIGPRCYNCLVSFSIILQLRNMLSKKHNPRALPIQNVDSLFTWSRIDFGLAYPWFTPRWRAGIVVVLCSNYTSTYAMKSLDSSNHFWGATTCIAPHIFFPRTPCNASMYWVSFRRWNHCLQSVLRIRLCSLGRVISDTLSASRGLRQ